MYIDNCLNAKDYSSIKNQSFILKVIQYIKDYYNIHIISLKGIKEKATQNKNFIISTCHGNYFMKIYSSGSVDERIFETNILKMLSSNNQKFVASTILDKPILIDGIPIMLFEIIDGHSLLYKQVTKKDLFTIAHQLSQMHNILQSFNQGKKIRFGAFDFNFIFEFNLEIKDPLIYESVNILNTIFNSLDKKKLVSTIIHDDLSPANIMKTPDDNLYFIDFDDAHYSYRISDIGTVVKEFIIQPLNKINEEKITSFIKNYELTNNTPLLTADERKLVIPMALRRALFMYAYYKFYEKKRNLTPGKSNIEYNMVKLIISSKGGTLTV